MDLNIPLILGAVRSHCMATGMFDKVSGYEPKTTPAPTGLAAGVWLGSIAPVARYSGLAVTSAAIGIVIRLYTTAQREPADATEPLMGNAINVLMTRLMADLELDGTVTSLDVFGFAGNPANAEP